MIQIPVSTGIQAQNGGLFISRGRGKHPCRTIDSHELILVTSGALRLAEEDTTFTVGPAEAIILLPHHQHRGLREYPLDLSYYWVHFTIEHVSYGQQWVRCERHSTIQGVERLVQAFRWFLDEQELGSLSQTRANLLVSLMLEIVSEADRSPAIAEMDDGGLGLAEAAMRIVRIRFAQEITTSSIAAELGCNPDYLGRVFRKRFRNTIVRAIHSQRIRYAKKLLLKGSVTVKEVAWRSGYREPAYFRRKFREIEGLSPRQFRALYARIHVNTE